MDCPVCDRFFPEGATQCPSCGFQNQVGPEGGAVPPPPSKGELAHASSVSPGSETLTGNTMLRGVIGGLIGASVGAFGWFLVAKISDLKIGWLAIGVGALAGLGVLLGARERGIQLQVIGVATAFFGWLLGEFLILQFILTPQGFDPPFFTYLAEVIKEDPINILFLVLALAGGFSIPKEN